MFMKLWESICKKQYLLRYQTPLQVMWLARVFYFSFLKIVCLLSNQYYVLTKEFLHTTKKIY